MRYFLDTEFLEDGTTIEPISLGIRSEDDRDFYIEFDFDEPRVRQSEFLLKNVIPNLTPGLPRVNRSDAASLLLDFVGNDDSPQFWAWYASYDWIVLCQLFGRMIDLPSHFPRFICDLRQTCAELNIDRTLLPSTPPNAHNALADAIWLKSAHSAVSRIGPLLPAALSESDGA